MLQILSRMFGAHLPHNTVVERQLGMRARADTQIVAKLPVIQVVAAAVSWPGVGGGFVMFITRCTKFFIQPVLHGGTGIVVRQVCGWGAAKRRVRFQRQMVAGQVRRVE